MPAQPQTTSSNDEVDLLELLKVLWDKKVWLLISTFVFTTIAGIYAFTAKEQWTSQAEVIAPKVSDIGSYFHIRKEYARILGQNFDANELEKALFNRFNLVSESLDKRKAFFEQSNVYRRLSEGKEDQHKRIILSELITKNTNVIKPDPKKEPNLLGRKISFYAETPAEAQDTLQQFITFTGQSAYQLELENFLIDFNEIISDLNYEKNKFERNLAIEKKVQLENLHNALKIAQQAGIKDYAEPFRSTNDTALQVLAMSEIKLPLSDSKLSDSSYLFMLGEKYLKAQIDVLKQEAIVYPPRYYEVTAQLQELEPLLVKLKGAKANTFSYQASPNYPVIKDKPKKVIIFGLGTAIGFILACFIFSIKYIYQNKRKPYIK
ncbi:chain length determination protein [Muribacter muris]|uniref:Chain length determination protein n=1 Tax=Muribacter muris TaxID=67855 RepID=A0A4Y9K1J8_9PAST|nr:Wzz/FepE/Etk N-terminal domain-containing protein [Muribacter muris]MBF0784793.1 LPS O-antigen chain length determinant protein WzzB [Muribacter muris]MBF0826648.1 LPS O-antigen chain length determinant protein WzzB [Muribacter muris]TFV11029.1 chain length determination protein [Muribacter muris]